MIKIFTLVIDDEKDKVSCATIRKILNNADISVEDIELDDVQ
jgi:hypothetical protein